MTSEKDKYDICETIIRILDSSISPDEFRLFEKKLNESAEIRSMYMTVLEACAHMQKPGHSFSINALGTDDEDDRRRLWQSLAKMEKEAPPLEIEKIEQKPELIRKVSHEKTVRPFNKSTLIPIFTAVAAVLCLMLFVRFAPVRDTYHGQITDTYQAVFADSMSARQRGGYLSDETLKLEKGLARIQMDDGSIVLLEAPAEFRLEADDQIFLIQGQLTADVPKSGIGFTVRTPSASVVDYGTEFGVSIDQYAKTEAHVLKGNVELRLGSNERVFEKSMRLSAHQAGAVSGQTLTTIPARVEQFTYAIPSAFQAYAATLDPILYFRLKENEIHTLCNVTDKSGLEILPGPYLKAVQGPMLGAGQFACAVQMDNGVGLEINKVLPVFSDQAGDYTVACWVRFDRIQNQIVWSNHTVSHNAAGQDDAYYRILRLNDEGRLEHTAYFPANPPGSRRTNSVVSADTLKPDQWYFVAVTHAKGKYKELYLNGRLVAQSSTLQTMPLEKYNKLTLGRAVDELAPGLTGAVSEILFFNRDLSEKENRMLYESASAK